MATARTFVTLYTLVAKRCQDLSPDGLQSAKDGINQIIRELTRDFKLPEVFKGYDSSVSVTPTIGTGPQLLNLASDIVRLSNVWWVDNAQTIWPLTEIMSDTDWLVQTDKDSDGDPVVYRYFQPSSGASQGQLQIWTSPNSSWVSKSNGLLYYSYWAQLAQLVNDGDVPNLPYELDTVLVNGGIVEMARSQGDTLLIGNGENDGMYLQKYNDDLGSIRAWSIKQKTQDAQMAPDMPLGTFGVGSGNRGYKIGSNT